VKKLVLKFVFKLNLYRYTKGDAQLVLLDLPGIVGPEHYRNPTHATKVGGAWASAVDCDYLLFIVDAHRQVKRPDPRIPNLLASVGLVAPFSPSG
jgi:GTP-binding protein Era